MRFASGTVLGLAALVSSRALWQALVTHEMPLDVALTRYLASAALIWAGLSLVVHLIGPPASRTVVTSIEPGQGISPEAPTDPSRRTLD